MISIAYILGEYPGKTETFISQEIKAISSIGHIKIIVFALQKGGGIPVEGVEVLYLPSLKSFSILWANLRLFFTSLIYLNEIAKILRKRRYVFKGLSALYKAAYFTSYVVSYDITHIHAHFANAPTDVAMKLSVLCKIKYSFTAHAYDIYVDGIFLREKIIQASHVVTCTNYNELFLKKILSQDEAQKIFHIYHGIDLNQWKFSPSDFSGGPIKIVSVGRLVEKKGYKYLIEAVSQIALKLPVQLTIIGEGPCEENLKKLVASLRVEKYVNFTGWMTWPQIQAIFRQSHIFILPCIYAQNNDRDGLPNVLQEAMAHGLPIITTPVSAIPEFLSSENCTLVSPNDSTAIANAVCNLIQNPKQRDFLVKQARATIEKYDIKKSAQMLSDLFLKFV